MATTVGQHTVATFTSPVNGTTPIDANTVRGNDNTLRTSYNDHDSDTGIHVQSSTFASRPVAGTAGRKWITVDVGGDLHLWYDNGTTWEEVGNSSVEVLCIANSDLTAGDVVKVIGFNNGQSLPIIDIVDSGDDVGFGVVDVDITNGSTGYVVNTGIARDFDTSAFAVGDILYKDTSGGFTTTKPTSGEYQPCGIVLRSNANNGVLYVEFSAPRIVERSTNTASTVVLRDASGNFAAGTITAGALTSTGLVTFASLKGTGATTVTNILDEDNMASNSATALATQQSIKAYVDSQVGTVDTLAEILANGNTSGGTNLIMSAGDTLTVNTIAETTVGAGVTIDSVLLKDDVVNATDIETGTLSANDGTTAATIANATGKLTISAAPTVSALTASQAVFTDASKNLVSNAITGTGNVVMSASPTLTGTVTAATLNATTLGGTLSTAAQPNVTSVGTLTSLAVSGNLTVDTNTLFVDSVNNRVGIGTTSPTAPLHVVGNASLGNRATPGTSYIGKLREDNGGITNAYGIGFVNTSINGDGYIEFYTTPSSGSGSIKMTLDGDGNLGIGVTPSYRLHVVGGATIANRTTSDTAGDVSLGVLSTASVAQFGWRTDTSNNLHFDIYNGASWSSALTTSLAGNLGLGVTPSAWQSIYRALDVPSGSFFGRNDGGIETGIYANAYRDSGGTRRYRANGVAMRYEQSADGHTFFTAASGTAGNAISFTQAMTIDSSQNVSITGALSKGSGSFRIEHPLPAKADTHNLVHSFIEGPRADLIYRGIVNLVDGFAEVDLDEAATMTTGTWELLCRDAQVFVQNESGWSLVRGSVSGSTLTINAQDNTSTDTVSWIVVAERKDAHMMDTNWTDDNGRVIVEPLKEIKA